MGKKDCSSCVNERFSIAGEHECVYPGVCSLKFEGYVPKGLPETSKVITSKTITDGDQRGISGTSKGGTTMNNCSNCGYAQPCGRCRNFEGYPHWIAIDPWCSIFDNNAGTTEEAKNYQVGTVQPIEIMQDYMTNEQFIGFLKGNVIKYLLRIGHNDNDLEDSGKALQYSKWLCVAINGGKIVPGGK